MALFIDGMACSICERPMEASQQLFGTSGVWLPPSDPLQQYCDSMLHWDCYAQMHDRARFAKSYFDFWIEEETLNPYWCQAFRSDSLFVTVNPDPPVESAWVILAATGTRHRVELNEWEPWLNRTSFPEHPAEANALKSALSTLGAALPTSEVLLAAIDRGSKVLLLEKLRQGERQREVDRTEAKRRIDQHNLTCERLMGRIQEHGARCPQCAVYSKDFRLSTRPDCRSLIICRKCGGVLDAVESR